MTENDIRDEWKNHLNDTLPKEELDNAFAHVMAAADEMEKDGAGKGSRSRTSRIGFRRAIFSCAAAAAMLVFIPWITLKVNDRLTRTDADSVVADAAPKMCQVATNNGETREVTLPDDSKVLLNAGSVVIYPEKFCSGERSVFLSGEAIFEVTHDSEHPFIVNTSDIAITVHGTIFNVNAYPEAGRTSATLCEGSISAALPRGGKTVDMVPDQRLSYDRGTGEATLTRVNSAEDTAWRRGDMCFRSEDIHDIVRAIERKYGVNAYITSGKYDGMILTAKFVHGETLDQMLRAICKLVPGMSYRIENDSVYIR